MKRFFKWVFFGFNALMLVSLIAGVASKDKTDCGTLSAQTCNDAYNTGKGIGVALLLILWAVGAVILGLLFIVAPSKKRDCPACGKGVKKGLTTCRACGHDFKAAIA